MACNQSTCSCAGGCSSQPCGTLGVRRLKREERTGSGLATLTKDCPTYFQNALRGSAPAAAQEEGEGVPAAFTATTPAATMQRLTIDTGPEPFETTGGNAEPDGFPDGSGAAHTDAQGLASAAAIGVMGLIGLGLIAKALES